MSRHYVRTLCHEYHESGTRLIVIGLVFIISRTSLWQHHLGAAADKLNSAAAAAAAVDDPLHGVGVGMDFGGAGKSEAAAKTSKAASSCRVERGSGLASIPSETSTVVFKERKRLMSQSNELCEKVV